MLGINFNAFPRNVALRLGLDGISFLRSIVIGRYITEQYSIVQYSEVRYGTVQ